MADTVVGANDPCCANGERTERELLQPRPRPGGLVFLAGGLPLRPLPPLLFPSKYPPLFTQLQVFSTQALAFVLPTCWVRHSHHASTSTSSTLLLSRVCPPSIPPLLVSGPTFRGGGVPTLLPHCQHRRILASIDVMNIDSCENSIARTPKVYSCRAACCLEG